MWCPCFNFHLQSQLPCVFVVLSFKNLNLVQHMQWYCRGVTSPSPKSCDVSNKEMTSGFCCFQQKSRFRPETRFKYKLWVRQEIQCFWYRMRTCNSIIDHITELEQLPISVVVVDVTISYRVNILSVSGITPLWVTYNESSWHNNSSNNYTNIFTSMH